MSLANREPLDSITDRLAADHVRIDEYFAVASRLAADGKLLDAESVFDDFSRALRGHIILEEELLFPVLERHAGFVGPTTVMRHEHRAIEHGILRARTELVRGNPLGFIAVAGELAALLGQHNHKEERVLYPRADAALDASERSAVVRKLGSR
jgi:iron-sulfur cluster repair protein YtfE (RIC family)